MVFNLLLISSGTNIPYTLAMENKNKIIKAISDVYFDEIGNKATTGFTITYEDETFKNFVKLFYICKKNIEISQMKKMHKEYKEKMMSSSELIEL